MYDTANSMRCKQDISLGAQRVPCIKRDFHLVTESTTFLVANDLCEKNLNRFGNLIS